MAHSARVLSAAGTAAGTRGVCAGSQVPPADASSANRGSWMHNQSMYAPFLSRVRPRKVG